jgi:hypothetical protein
VNSFAKIYRLIMIEPTSSLKQCLPAGGAHFCEMKKIERRHLVSPSYFFDFRVESHANTLFFKSTPVVSEATLLPGFHWVSAFVAIL